VTILQPILQFAVGAFAMVAFAVLTLAVLTGIGFGFHALAMRGWRVPRWFGKAFDVLALAILVIICIGAAYGIGGDILG